jgi:sugar phosphate isomerase/epimerase
MRDFSRGPEYLAINQATTKGWSLEQAIEGYARHGVRGIAVWRDRLAELGVQRAAGMLKVHDMTVTGICRAGLLPDAGGGWAAALDDNRRAIDEAAALGARCLIMVAGGLPRGSKDLAGAHAAVRDGLAELLPHARAAKVPLALEPLHPMFAADRACVNTLMHANGLCDALGPGIGVAVDVYHVWWDPNLEREIARAGAAKRLLAFHVCDWLVPTTDLLLDRGMMGDGVIDIRRIRGWMEAAGYSGFCEAEIFSAKNWWQRPCDEVVRTCVERHRTVV